MKFDAFVVMSICDTKGKVCFSAHEAQAVAAQWSGLLIYPCVVEIDTDNPVERRSE